MLAFISSARAHTHTPNKSAKILQQQRQRRRQWKIKMEWNKRQDEKWNCSVQCTSFTHNYVCSCARASAAQCNRCFWYNLHAENMSPTVQVYGGVCRIWIGTTSSLLERVHCFVGCTHECISINSAFRSINANLIQNVARARTKLHSYWVLREPWAERHTHTVFTSCLRTPQSTIFYL